MTGSITVILLKIVLAGFSINVAQIFYEQHGKDVVLIAGAIDLAAEAVAGVPKYFFYILFGSHFQNPLFILL